MKTIDEWYYEIERHARRELRWTDVVKATCGTIRSIRAEALDAAIAETRKVQNRYPTPEYVAMQHTIDAIEALKEDTQ